MQKATKPAAVAPGVQKPATKLTKKQALKKRMEAMSDRSAAVKAKRCAEKLAAEAAAKPTIPEAGPPQALETVDHPVTAGDMFSTPPSPATVRGAGAGALA